MGTHIQLPYDMIPWFHRAASTACPTRSFRRLSFLSLHTLWFVTSTTSFGWFDSKTSSQIQTQHCNVVDFFHLTNSSNPMLHDTSHLPESIFRSCLNNHDTIPPISSTRQNIYLILTYDPNGPNTSQIYDTLSLMELQ